MSTTETESAHDYDHDIVIVGGGPAGCSAGVFTARYGLDTIIFDRGRSSIQRCAHLENYLGFPAGIDIEMFYELMHEHAETAGCEIVPDLVDSVEQADDEEGFVVTPQEGEAVTARRVIAATRYDGEYMRGLDDAAAMFEPHDGDEHFDRTYAASNGTTPVDRLYVASPSKAADRQAIMAAGYGARVGLQVIEDIHRDRGYPDAIVEHYDWLRRDTELEGEWGDRDRWREWIDGQFTDEHDLNEDQRVAIREEYIDRRFDTYLSTDETAHRKERGQKALLKHIDDGLILDAARDIEADR
ncbi:NAD(P)/FAD-dependent oxidoreductase [Halobaculum sp. CBA1158]|uniref:NAD(P)/FAD-dependent oxidoreductase n=1 Tax=Halobaculum sp. CBA1158 TaxID=2904243 RepID=UPI001F352658|nr:NAD(P)/FAD-dependent oxidoreductase [Halobaculum sp. CBA1158]UIO99496.1 NAD(P)/FAD-dependent oxidoreductase [Halobaculum sp. CBA1158]